jgi:peptidoglycan-associated lipoprotein
MNKTRGIFYCLSLCVFLFSSKGFAQKNAASSADKAFQAKEYFDAIDQYKKAYTDLKGNGAKNEKARIIFMIAECYRMMDDPKQEEQWYTKAIKGKYDDPLCYLYLADAQKMQANYDDAIGNYQKFKEAVPSDPRGDAGIKSCQMAAQLKNNPTRYVVVNESQINGKTDDFGVCFSDKRGDEIIFTSARQGGSSDKVDNGTGQAFTDLFIAKRDKLGKWSAPTPLPSPINSENNEGTPTMDRGFKTLYFTRCLLVQGVQSKCKIYSADRRGTAWADPVKLAFQIDSVTYGQPSLSADGQELFFSSDLTGGSGGHDIWISHWDKKARAWGEPVNAGPTVNTPGDEEFPFIHADGTLYISSNGMPGLGGFDIYKAKKTGADKWDIPQNMGVPINSEADDFGIIFDGNKERGFFASTRTGGKGNADIYSFALPPLLFDLQGQVVDKDTKKGIYQATVHLVGSDGSDVSLKADTGGYYNFGANGNARYIKPNTSYIVSAGATDLKYLNSDEKANETTVGLTESKTFVHNFELQKATITTEIKFPRVEYGLDSATLRTASKDSLNYLVKTLNDNPTIVIELDAHTDQQGQLKHNMTLSQARAQSCVDYLESKGIDSARLVAKGWGPTKLLISTAAINKMKTKQEKDAAYQTNRRTVFRVLRFDFVPKGHVMTIEDSMKMKALEKAKISGQENDNDTTDAGVPLPPAPPANNGGPSDNSTPAPANGGGNSQQPNATTPKKQ